jgi:hypothetical protein
LLEFGEFPPAIKPNGDFDEICGRATVPNPTKPGEIKVTFDIGKSVFVK